MDLSQFLFAGWESLLRALVVGVPLYLLLIVMLRTSGKHSLAKNNAYGLVVTVSLGSALASGVLTKQVTLADGVFAIGLLLALQYVVAWAASRYGTAQSAITQEPSLLVQNGQMLRDAMRDARITPQEIYSAIRQAGHDSVESVYAVVFEADGSLSVIREPGPTGSAMQNVRGHPAGPPR